MPRLDTKAEAVTPLGRVLLVDDDPELRRAFGRYFRTRGYVITQAANGREAVKLTSGGEFDVVVTDVRMPDMDGVELLRALHERDADLPVLLISGAPDLATAMRAIEYGAFEYVTKPAEMDKLQASMQRAVEARRKRLEAKRELDNYRSGDRPRVSGAAEPPGESWTGGLLGGRYRVGALIGEGGMGAVYEAVREDLAHMRVAIKVLHPAFSARAELVARFRREAETVAAIDHPNIVKIIDFQARSAEPAFLVMERLYGMSLGHAIANDGCFSEARAAFIGCQVLAALGAAHAARVVHRDLKPDNVFLTSVSGVSDIVKLLDFGIAKLLGTNAQEKLTQTGMVMGTPPYMAPEYARGGQVDARTDLYAVGCVMYEALTCRAPFSAENYNALLFAIQEKEPEPLRELRPDLDPEFVAVVTRAMNKDPALRFQSAEAMARALGRWSAPSSEPSARPPDSSGLAFVQTQLTPNDGGNRARPTRRVRRPAQRAKRAP